MKQRIKSIISKIITSKIVYNLIVKRKIKNGYLSLKTGLLCVENQSIYIKSLLFWGLYEKDEKEFIEKYLYEDLPIIELGCSIGFTSLSICSKSGVQVLSIEANPRLIDNLYKTKNINKLDHWSIYNKAISPYKEKTISFVIDSNNLGSSIELLALTDENVVIVETTTLSEIVESMNIDEYVIVSDIEGAEIQFLTQSSELKIMEKCKQMIIELHPTNHQGTQYSINDLVDIIVNQLNFKLKEAKKNVYVFIKGI